MQDNDAQSLANDLETRRITKVRYWRLKRGYSLDELSFLASVPKSTLHLYDCGVAKRLNLRVLQKIEAALELPRGTLLY